jgi:hypothetical protein
MPPANKTFGASGRLAARSLNRRWTINQDFLFEDRMKNADRSHVRPSKKSMGHRSEKRRLVRMLTAALRRAGVNAAIHYDAQQFCLTLEGDGNRYLLGNCYRQYLATPRAGRPDVVRAFVESWLSCPERLPSAFTEVEHHLLPDLQTRFRFEKTAFESSVNASSFRVLGEHFGVGLVYDLPKLKFELGQERLTACGVDFDTAMRAAYDNLRAVSKEGLVPEAPGVWRSPWEDNYAASRLVFPDLIRRSPVHGDHVVMVPNRDTLLVTGSEDPEGLRVLASLCEEYLSFPWSLSGMALRLQGDAWVPFLPPADHPQYHAFSRLALESIAADYADQKELLQADHLTRNVKAAVADFLPCVVVRPGPDSGQLCSLCFWLAGGETLLPQAERVLFARLEGGKLHPVAAGSWERVRAVVGHLMEPLGLYPERYRVREFPTAEQLEAIGEPDRDLAKMAS